ncbi:hypothetical protein F4805DRAFT_352954 [Annulohypoxylon moriforme]|nr:hypothetical protein F4805DRAFT_352954 [Annulohypoxylon moriforme]
MSEPLEEQRPEDAAQINSIIREIQSIYDADTLFFTKEVIRKVGDELQIFQKEEAKGREITLRGVDGTDYKVSVAAPSHNTPAPKNQHLGGSTWMISYHSIRTLTSYEYQKFMFMFMFNPQTAYLPMQILSFTKVIENPFEYEEKRPMSSTDDLRLAFQEVERQWRTSEYHERLQAALTMLETPLVLDKVVALALGHIVAGSHINDRSIIQHALVSSLHSTLRRRGILTAASKRYVQEPGYTQKDRDVLSSEGFTILNDPQAFITLDESSILVSICPDPPVEDIVVDICRPGIILWDDVRKSHPLSRRDSPRVVKMIKEEYYEVEFPYHESLGNLAMYIRKAA